MPDAPTLTDAPESVEDLPPSAKLVWLHLQLHGPATQQDIAEGTRLSLRTTRYGIRRLEEADAIESSPKLRDLRQDYYTALSD